MMKSLPSLLCVMEEINTVLLFYSVFKSSFSFTLMSDLSSSSSSRRSLCSVRDVPGDSLLFGA